MIANDYGIVPAEIRVQRSRHFAECNYVIMATMQLDLVNQYVGFWDAKDRTPVLLETLSLLLLAEPEPVGRIPLSLTPKQLAPPSAWHKDDI
jgi:hypothetical protein